MKPTDLFLAELERERRAPPGPRAGAARSRRWTPHSKSMPLARLAGLVAAMPSWIGLIIEQDELNLTPPPGRGTSQQPPTNTLVAVHDENVQQGRDALSRTTDESS